MIYTLTTTCRSSKYLDFKREAERLILDASTEVSEYRNWLAGVISEAERLYRIQSQSLDSAENAISQSRQRLESAFNRLAELQKQVVSAISADGTPSADAKVVDSLGGIEVCTKKDIDDPKSH